MDELNLTDRPCFPKLGNEAPGEGRLEHPEARDSSPTNASMCEERSKSVSRTTRRQHGRAKRHGVNLCIPPHTADMDITFLYRVRVTQPPSPALLFITLVFSGPRLAQSCFRLTISDPGWCGKFSVRVSPYLMFPMYLLACLLSATCCLPTVLVTSAIDRSIDLRQLQRINLTVSTNCSSGYQLRLDTIAQSHPPTCVRWMAFAPPLNGSCFNLAPFCHTNASCDGIPRQPGD